ncbi:MAG TPA: T9SS type A sorting domain-containing protein [Niastella sp.]|nr:T9SS type A sorting domain-containing protein [Niastella sp.]
MNPIETVKKHRNIRTLPALFTLAILFATAAANASTGCPLSIPASSPDTILVQKQVTSKKHKIKLYPGTDQDALFFSVRGTEEKVYQLFLFDVAGNLIRQANIKGRQTTVIDNIEKGNYLFEVFSDDERIENGQVIIR